MFEKRINELKQKTEETFLEYNENPDEILYNVACNDAISKRSKSDMIRGIITLVVIIVISVPFVWYYGSLGAIFVYLYSIRVLYLLFIGDHIRSKITNPYEIKSFKPELKTTKKSKK